MDNIKTNNKTVKTNLNLLKTIFDKEKLCLENKESKSKLIYISIFDIVPDKNQPRKIFNETTLNSLAESIKKIGIIQPLSVKPKNENGKYEIIAGERRYRAAKIANLTKIPVIIIDKTSEENQLISLTENIQRENINIFEEAEALKEILKNTNQTQASLAKILGKAQCTIANKLRLLNFSDEERFLIISHNLSERHCREFIREKNIDKRITYINEACENNLTVAQVKQIIDCDQFLYGYIKAPENMQNIINSVNGQIAFQETTDTLINLNNPDLQVSSSNYTHATKVNDIENINEKSENQSQIENTKSVKITKNPKSKSLFYIKDVRLFINTINKAIEVMKNSGINADAKKVVNDDVIEYVIKIPVNKNINANNTATKITNLNKKSIIKTA